MSNLKRLYERLKSKVIRPKYLYPYSIFEIKKNIIYIHIPKNAGTSLTKAINGITKPRVHTSWKTYASRNPKRFENSYKFTVLREPVERFESALGYILKGGNGGKSDKAIELYIKQKLELNEFFEENTICYLKENFNIFKPQSYFVCDDVGRLKVDKVYSIKNLDILAYDLAKYDIDYNSSVVVNKSSPQFTLTLMQRQLIKNIYCDDIKLWRDNCE